jgi:hypothetical protein
MLHGTDLVEQSQWVQRDKRRAQQLFGRFGHSIW